MDRSDNQWLEGLDRETRLIFKQHNITSPEQAFEVAEAIVASVQKVSNGLLESFSPVIDSFNTFLENIPGNMRDDFGLPFRIQDTQTNRDIA